MLPNAKPFRTGTGHLLPFAALSPLDFERLCLWLVSREGYEHAEHWGEAGGDDGRDVLAWKDGRRVAFQCKRVRSFSALQGRREVQKLRRLPLAERPAEVVFVVARAVSASVRTAIRAEWGNEATCQFWAGSELDALVKRHPDLLGEFFDLPPQAHASFVSNLPFASLGPLFQGRKALLDRLREMLVGASSGPAAVVKAVHGLGGVGKTRLDIEYAWHYAGEYSAVLFAGAVSPSDLRRNLSTFCSPGILDLPEQAFPEEEAQLAAVIRRLGELPTWLLILDNVDSEEAGAAVTCLVAQLHGGHVLLTGRLARWEAEVEPMELDVLSEEDAAGFLLDRTAGSRRAATDDAALAATLVHELGGLPLALEHAGAYIARHRLTIAGYFAEWQSHRERVLESFDPRVCHYNASIAVTWQTSVNRLSGRTRWILELLSWLAPEPIPETLLDGLIPDLPVLFSTLFSFSPRESLAELAAYSLVTRSAQTPTFTVHRLVQDVTRRGLMLQPTGRTPFAFARRLILYFIDREAMKKYLASAALTQALGWVTTSFVGDPSDVRSWPVLEPLIPHARAVVLFADAAGIAHPTAVLMNQIAQMLYAKALLAEAEPLMQRALAIDEASFGVDHPNVAIRLNNLANLLHKANRLAESEKLLRRALAIDEASFGADHPSVARDLSNLAVLLEVTNRFAEAEPLVRRAVAIDEASFGADHANVAIRLNNLAKLLSVTNRLAEAEALMRRALAIDETRFGGADHPDLAVRLNNLAQLLRDTNRYAEAEPLIRRALVINETSLGAEHPEVAVNLTTLGGLLSDTNRRAEAEPLLRRALAIDETRFGAEHSAVGKDLNNLARLLQDANRRAEAEPLLRRALAICETSFGVEHPSVAAVLRNRAELLRDTDRLAETEPLLRRALAIDEKSYGSEHPIVAGDLISLSRLLQATSRFDEAERAVRRALAIDERSFGAEHPNVSRDLNNLVEILEFTDRHGETEPLLRRALAIDEKCYGAEHPIVARDLNNLAQILQVSERHAEAEPLLRRALAIDEKTYGAEHPIVASLLNNLALLLRATNRLAEAEPLLRHALTFDEQSFHGEHLSVARDLNNLACLLKDMERSTEAEPLACRALAIFHAFSRRTGHAHPHLEAVQQNYALILQKLGKSMPVNETASADGSSGA